MKYATSLSAVLLLSGSACLQAALPRSLDGHWYNPAQSGHGLSLEIVNDQRAVLIWFTYDLAGHPKTLYLDGQIEGNSIIAQAFAPTGMRFGSFNSADLDFPEWGEVVVDFSDCSTARLTWFADDSAYGAGDLPLQRLTNAAAPSCSLDGNDHLPQGDYADSAAFGRVNASGKILAATAGSPWPNLPPMLIQQLSGPWQNNQVTIGTLSEAIPETVGMAMRRMPNAWLCLALASNCPDGSAALQWTSTFYFLGASISGIGWPVGALHAPGTPIISVVHPDNPGLLGYVHPVYQFPVEGDDPEAPRGRLEIANNGDLCIRVGQSACLYRGSSTIRPGSSTSNATEHSFELRPQDAALPAFSVTAFFYGTETLGFSPDPELWLYGTNGEVGMGLQTRPLP